MPNLNEPAKWNADAAALLRQFISSKTGRLFLQHLVEARPNLSSAETLEGCALRAKLVEGYERAIAKVISLGAPDDDGSGQVERPLYPDLDDESAWAGIAADSPVPTPQAAAAPTPPTPNP